LAKLLHTDTRNGLDPKGKDLESLDEHLTIFGPNKLKPAAYTTFLALCWDKVQDPTLIMLIVAALVSEGIQPGRTTSRGAACSLSSRLAQLCPGSRGRLQRGPRPSRGDRPAGGPRRPLPRVPASRGAPAAAAPTPPRLLQVSTILGSAIPAQRAHGEWVEGVAIWIAVIIVTLVGGFGAPRQCDERAASHAAAAGGGGGAIAACRAARQAWQPA